MWCTCWFVNILIRAYSNISKASIGILCFSTYTPPTPHLHIHFLGIDKYKTVISWNLAVTWALVNINQILLQPVLSQWGSSVRKPQAKCKAAKSMRSRSSKKVSPFISQQSRWLMVFGRILQHVCPNCPTSWRSPFLVLTGRYLSNYSNALRDRTSSHDL